MGYTTDFYGEFDITPVLAPEHRAYLARFADVRHMKRDVKKLQKLPDPLRTAVGLPIGFDGAFFLGDGSGTGTFGDVHPESVIEYNSPPGQPVYDAGIGGFKTGAYQQHTQDVEAAIRAGAQPGLWCQWVPDGDGKVLQWDEGEKFYNYVEWLQYLCDAFFTPWGYTLTGEVFWSGEDSDDRGKIVMTGAANQIETKVAVITYQ